MSNNENQIPNKSEFDLVSNNKKEKQEIEIPNDQECINYSNEFDKWTIFHYFAMKKRHEYPNMFFFYFPRSLFKLCKITEIDKQKIIDYIFHHKGEEINGNWGYLSLLIDNPNLSGEEIHKLIYMNNTINITNSFPLNEKSMPNFDEEIAEKVKKILEERKSLYDNVLNDFENNLVDDIKKKYQNFLKKHENYNANINIFTGNEIKKLISCNNVLKNKNIFLKNKNYNQNKRNYNNINNTNNKASKKLQKRKQLFKIDFDEGDNEDLILSYGSESEINNKNYYISKENINKNKIISDDEECSNISISIGQSNDIKDNDYIANTSKGYINRKKGKKQKSTNYKTSKQSKKIIDYNNNSKIEENPLEYQENVNVNNNDSIKKNLNFNNINYSTNLSSNLNDNNFIYSNNNSSKKNTNITNKKNDLLINSNDMEDVEFLENEQNDGYVSDFTKKIYIGNNEINNKILMNSDNEEDRYIQKVMPKKKKKVYRVKIDKPVISRKTNTNKIKDFNLIGVDTFYYTNKNIDKLKRGLMRKKYSTKMKIEKKKYENKKNKILKELRSNKNYKEEDFNKIQKEKNIKKLLQKITNIQIEKNNIILNTKKEPTNFEYKNQYYEILSSKGKLKNREIKNKKYQNKKEEKEEANFFNCFTIPDKEDINISDTESFLSLFNRNQDLNKIKKNKRNNKKINSIFCTEKNQKLNEFFPVSGKSISFIKNDKQIVFNIKSFIENTKYNFFYNFIENDISNNKIIPRFISDIAKEMSDYGNSILDEEKLINYKNNENKYEIYSSERDEKIIVDDQYDLEKLIPCFKVYLEKMQIALTYDKFKNNKEFTNGKNLYKQSEINSNELIFIENLIKLLIKHINESKNINFSEKDENIENNDNIKNEFNNYLTSVNNIFQTQEFTETISQICITYLRFLISYKPRDFRSMDIKFFCFMNYSFSSILKALFDKEKELVSTKKKLLSSISNFNTNNIFIPSLLKEITNKYMKCLNLFLLIRLFLCDPINFLSKKNNFSKGRIVEYEPKESLIFMALYELTSNLYKDFNSKNNKNEINNDSIDMLNIIFNEYLYNDLCEIDTSNLGKLNEITIKNLRTYLSKDSNNCLSKEKKEISIISNIKKYFIYSCFDINNELENDPTIKNVIKEKILIHLIHRYLFVLICYFIHCNKETNCLKYFNDFYENFNDIKKNKSSYFKVETLAKELNKNPNLLGNKKCKPNLVELYLYSDVELMNFFDRHFQINFNEKKTFIQKYFEIMCDNNYKSRIIDNIFTKDESIKLINYIFYFNDNNQNDANNINDNFFSIDNDFYENNNINKKRNEILESNSVLIKLLYLISESINKTLTSPELCGNEKNIKTNLSKCITISNVFNNISHLNNNNYTLFVIPMISTILIFSQHLIKFKDINTIKMTINKIKDLLNLESSSLLLKSFSLSIWLNIIQKIIKQNVNIDIRQYINMINSIINNIFEEYTRLQQNFNKYYNNSNENKYLEIIQDYLKNIKYISTNNPELIIDNIPLIKGMESILNKNIYYPPKMRLFYVEIIENLLKYINRDIYPKGNNNIINANNEIHKENYINNGNGGIDLTEDEFNLLLIEELESSKFFDFLEDYINPKLKEIIEKFISKENTGVSNKQKIFYPVYEQISCLYCKIIKSTLIHKKNINANYINYPRYIFSLYYNAQKDNQNNRKNILKEIFQLNCSIDNDKGKELYIKLPFKLFNIYIENYDSFFKDILQNRDFNEIIKYFLQIFFIGVFIYNTSNESKIFCYEKIFTENFISIIKNNKKLFENEKQKLKKQYKVNKIYFENNKDKIEKISIYNLLLILADLNANLFTEDKKDFSNNIYLLFDPILANLSLNFNIDLISSEYLFEIINGTRIKDALKSIKEMIEISNKDKNMDWNIRLYTLNKYLNEYINYELERKFENYIDEFIDGLAGEDFVNSNILTNFMNNLLINTFQDKNNNIGKFKKCINKIYEVFYTKSVQLSNILDIQNKRENVTEFSNNQLNQLLSNYHNNIKYNKNGFSLGEINFSIKENIILKFIKKPEQINIISPNFYINLLKIYISKNCSNKSIYSNNIKDTDDYYSEAIYYYVCLNHVFSKESNIDKIIQYLSDLFNLIILNNQKSNMNYITDLKSFYVFYFFIKKINAFMKIVMEIETLNDENYQLVSKKFVIEMIKIVEHFISFMYNYITEYFIKQPKGTGKSIYNFLKKKLLKLTGIVEKSLENNIKQRKQKYLNLVDSFLTERYRDDILLKGYNVVKEFVNIVTIYFSKKDDEIRKKIEFIEYINLDGHKQIYNMKNENDQNRGLNFEK